MIHASIHYFGKARSTLSVLKTIRFSLTLDNASVLLNTFKKFSTDDIYSETAFGHRMYVVVVICRLNST